MRILFKFSVLSFCRKIYKKKLSLPRPKNLDINLGKLSQFSSRKLIKLVKLVLPRGVFAN